MNTFFSFLQSVLGWGFGGCYFGKGLSGYPETFSRETATANRSVNQQQITQAKDIGRPMNLTGRVYKA